MPIKSQLSYKDAPEAYQEVCRKKRNEGLESLELLNEDKGSYTVRAESYDDFIEEFERQLNAVETSLNEQERTETWRDYSEEALRQILPNSVYQLSLQAL